MDVRTGTAGATAFAGAAAVLTYLLKKGTRDGEREIEQKHQNLEEYEWTNMEKYEMTRRQSELGNFGDLLFEPRTPPHICCSLFIVVCTIYNTIHYNNEHTFFANPFSIA